MTEALPPVRLTVVFEHGPGSSPSVDLCVLHLVTVSILAWYFSLALQPGTCVYFSLAPVSTSALFVAECTHVDLHCMTWGSEALLLQPVSQDSKAALFIGRCKVVSAAAEVISQMHAT